MVRKVKYNGKTIHDFTRQIHSTRRTDTQFAGMLNHNERLAKEKNGLTCKECRFFLFGCSEYVGRYHRTCPEFEWD